MMISTGMAGVISIALFSNKRVTLSTDSRVHLADGRVDQTRQVLSPRRQPLSRQSGGRIPPDAPATTFLTNPATSFQANSFEDLFWR